MDTASIGAAPQAPPKWKEEPWSAGDTLLGLWVHLTLAFKKHPVIFTFVTVIAVIALYVERDLLQPTLLAVRIYAPGLVLVLCLPVLLWLLVRKRSARAKAFGGVFGLGVIALVVFFGLVTHDYFAQYFRYLSEMPKIVELDQVPTTEFERLLPLNGVYTTLRQRMNETQEPSLPDLVRVGSGYQWTMAIQPAKWWGRVFDHIHEIRHILSTVPSPNFSDPNATSAVEFETGENMIWSKDVQSCVRRSFDPLRAFSYQPGNVLYMQDDAKQWVQVVTLIRWTGLLFPWPEFGGVQVIPQGDTTMIGRLLLGCGTWIPPEDVQNHAFLRGQNLIPYEVSRFMASSLRFQNGFWGPLPFNRVGDLRIADVAQDINPLPFTLPFEFKTPAGSEVKLYQYFALEPHDLDKKGLSTSLFVPADGIGPSYRYRHFTHGEQPYGPTAVGDLVHASNLVIDWSTAAPVEVRPYIRDIADANGVVKRRFEWMVTMVAINKRTSEDETISFTAGASPSIVIIDALRGTPAWVDPQDPSKWPEQLHQAFGPVWAAAPQQ